ncbi:hypothetical protein [Novosphingobium sp. Rr 2-17]|uniref:hypothetical protein n=1 Tax=Novosphingobium sp. Rr 2-17 TaxID=555793 RepID=UPI0012F64E99|nr:hypothetical protein [Novosphingobium sp. Rr 2-17]
MFKRIISCVTLLVLLDAAVAQGKDNKPNSTLAPSRPTIALSHPTKRPEINLECEFVSENPHHWGSAGDRTTWHPAHREGIRIWLSPSTKKAEVTGVTGELPLVEWEYSYQIIFHGHDVNTVIIVDRRTLEVIYGQMKEGDDELWGDSNYICKKVMEDVREKNHI